MEISKMYKKLKKMYKKLKMKILTLLSYLPFVTINLGKYDTTMDRKIDRTK